jgi:hypothetical protein
MFHNALNPDVHGVIPLPEKLGILSLFFELIPFVHFAPFDSLQVPANSASGSLQNCVSYYLSVYSHKSHSDLLSSRCKL